MAVGLARRIVGRSAAFYAANLASVLLPLVSVPYLARTLGPAAWGELALAQAIATGLAVLVDYGHAQSGTRALLRAGAASEARRLAGAILSGKLLLAVVGAAGLGVLGLLGMLPVAVQLLPAAIAAGIASGLSPLWLAQAGERVGRYLALDVTAKALAVVSLLVLVHEPGGAARVLWLQAAAGLGSFLSGLVLSSLRPSLRPSTARAVGALLWEHRHGFLFRATILTYTTANVLVLGFVAAPHEVGIFAAADRAVRLVACFAGPLGQALYPLLARAWQEDPAGAARLASTATLAVAAIGIGLGLGLLFAADRVALLLLGPGFADAAVVLRILAPLPALICVSNILGMQWMFSIGAEAAFVRILALAGLVCLPSGTVLGAMLGAPGMGIAATLAELVVTGGVLVHLVRSGSLPGRGLIGSRAHAH